MTALLGRTTVFAALAAAFHVGTQMGDGVRVCVGPDRVLRHEPGTECPAGTEEFLLAEAEPEIEAAETAAEPEKAQVAELQRQIAALTQQVASLDRAAASRSDALAQRVSTLEADATRADTRNQGPGARGQGVGGRVVAPFVVVDGAGKPIFTVKAEPRGFAMATSEGQEVVFASALPTSGFVKTRSGSGSREAVMGVVGDYAAVELRAEGGEKRAVMALQSDGKPIYDLRNDNGVPVAALSPGVSGGGYLQLGDAAGNSMVEAGVTAEGLGLVRAYPHGGSPGVGLVGFPGTFIMGRRVGQ